MTDSNQGEDPQEATFEVDENYEYDDDVNEPEETNNSMIGFEPVPLSPFEKIKLETDRKTAHGHPVILPTKHGSHGPVYDIFALFQNSVKKQLLVAYNTLEGLLRYKFAVSKEEIRVFFQWFDTFTDVVLAFLAVEEDELYPFLEQGGITLPLVISKLERMKFKDELASTIQHMDQQREMFQLLPPGEIVPRINKLVPSLLRSLVDYFDNQSAHLPQIVQSVTFENQKVTALRMRAMKALKARPNYSTYVVFMSHILRGPKLKAWKSEFLTTKDSFRYEQWRRKFINGYQVLPSQLIGTLMAETAAGDSTDGSNSNLSFYLNKKRNMYKV